MPHKNILSYQQYNLKTKEKEVLGEAKINKQNLLEPAEQNGPVWKKKLSKFTS